MKTRTNVERRSFLAGGLAGGAVALPAAAALAVEGVAHAGSKKAAAFVPAKHEQDDWFDTLPGKHRLIFDTTSPNSFGASLLYSSNFMAANKDGYGLQDSDSAIVIVARHGSTAFAYNDAMWEKYGKTFADRANFKDPKSDAPLKVNIFNASGYGTTLPNYGTTVNSILARGVHLAVCAMATRAIAGLVAGRGGDTEAVYKELTSNLLANARMVPAGIVAVNRGQERGYSLVVPS